jgi:hypothetical protein
LYFLGAGNAELFSSDSSEEVDFRGLLAKVAGFGFHDPGLGGKIYGDLFQAENRSGNGLQDFPGFFLMSLFESGRFFGRGFLFPHSFQKGQMFGIGRKCTGPETGPDHLPEVSAPQGKGMFPVVPVDEIPLAKGAPGHHLNGIGAAGVGFHDGQQLFVRGPLNPQPLQEKPRRLKTDGQAGTNMTVKFGAFPELFLEYPIFRFHSFPSPSIEAGLTLAVSGWPQISAKNHASPMGIEARKHPRPDS